MKKETLLGIARHALTTLGGSMVAGGAMDNNEMTAIVGGIVALAGVIWSVLEKRQRAAAAEAAK